MLPIGEVIPLAALAGQVRPAALPGQLSLVGPPDTNQHSLIFQGRIKIPSCDAVSRLQEVCVSVLLTQDQARIALRTTAEPIKLVRNTRIVRRTMDVSEVLMFLAAGHQFWGSLKRVKCIKFSGRVPEPLTPVVGRQSEPIATEKPGWSKCWRTVEAAVLSPWPRFGLRPGQGKIIRDL
jgi:hypothetical protein